MNQTFWHDIFSWHYPHLDSVFYFFCRYNNNIRTSLLISVDDFADLRHQAFARLIPLMAWLLRLWNTWRQLSWAWRTKMKRMLAQRTGLLERLLPIGVTGVTYRRPPRPGPCYRLQRVYAVVSCASAKDAWTQGPTNVGFGDGKHWIHSARDLELAALRRGCKAVMMPPRNCASPRLMWSRSDTTSNFQADWPWGFPCLASLWNCNNGSQFMRLLEDSTPGIERWIRWGRKPGSDNVALSEHLENFQFNITVWACFLILPEVNGNYDIDHSVPAPAPVWWDESEIRYNLCNGDGSYLIEAAHQLLFNEFDVEWNGLRLKFWCRNGLFVTASILRGRYRRYRSIATCISNVNFLAEGSCLESGGPKTCGHHDWGGLWGRVGFSVIRF